jgi:hypothetical protein
MAASLRYSFHLGVGISYEMKLVPHSLTENTFCLTTLFSSMEDRYNSVSTCNYLCVCVCVLTGDTSPSTALYHLIPVLGLKELSL